MKGESKVRERDVRCKGKVGKLGVGWKRKEERTRGMAEGEGRRCWGNMEGRWNEERKGEVG